MCRTTCEYLGGKNRSHATRRLTALVLDYLVILAWMTILALGSAVVYPSLGYYPDTLGFLGPIGSQILFFFLLTFVVGIYLYKCESGRYQATWGKRRMGLKVMDTRGGRLLHRQVIVRTAVKLAPWEVAHVFVWQMMWAFYQSGYDAMDAGMGLHRIKCRSGCRHPVCHYGHRDTPGAA